MSDEIKNLQKAIGNNMEIDRHRGVMNWETRQFIKRQYESGKTGFHEVFDFYSTFTPIEFAIWQDLSSLNLPFLPEYPVGQYFADFADPKKRIAIECDGKHHDKEQDRKRDDYFESEGWTVYRIPGSYCFGEKGTEIIRSIAERYQKTQPEAVQ